MTQKYDASSSVVRRLPRYYRLLGELERSGQVRTSSRELGRRLGMTASQIRQDLCCFGCFGQQGSGYSVAELRENLQRIMGLSEQLPAIVVVPAAWERSSLKMSALNSVAFGWWGFSTSSRN